MEEGCHSQHSQISQNSNDVRSSTYSHTLIENKGNIKLDEREEFMRSLDKDLTKKRYIAFGRKFKSHSYADSPNSGKEGKNVATSSLNMPETIRIDSD